MKRVLFVCNNLNHGGIPRALVNLLRTVSDTCQAELLLFEPSGDYLDEVPENVRLVPSEGLLYLLGVPQEELKKRSKSMALLRAFYVTVSRIFGNGWARKKVYATAPKLTGYDVAVSFAQDNHDKAFAIGCNAFVLDRVEAKKKVAFVHCDFENYGGNTPKNREAYKRFDRIACVSEGCRDAFLRVLPELEEKTVVVENCTDYEAVIRKGEATDISFGEGFNMVSVSRINPEKGLLRALDAIKPLMAEYPELRWHIVGDGPERTALENVVQEAGLSERVMFYGMQDNPYPYMNAADLFFLPSFHEAAPMVFEEARALGTPILTTRTLSSEAMVEKRQSGWVCENSLEGIRNGLQVILEHPKQLVQAKETMSKRPLDNRESVKQWEELLNRQG